MSFLDEESHLDYGELVHQLGGLAFEGRGAYFGWLTPNGVYIGTGHTKHDEFARRILNQDPEFLEDAGWVKIHSKGRANLKPGAELTEAQAAYLLKRMES